MNQKEFKACSQNDVAALFKITSRCNDNCIFCIERKYMKKGRDDLSLEEIRANFEYLRSNFCLDYVIITGGEPTIHKDFLDIVDYFHHQLMEFRFITNLIQFGDEKFFPKILPYLPSNKNRVIGSINDLPDKSEIAYRRIEGLKNVLRQKLPIMLIMVIYKDNLESLADIVLYLADLFKKYKYYKPINLELRLIYVEGTLKSLLRNSLPADFKKIKESVQKTIKIADMFKVTISLWNFPLCYLNDIPRFLDKTILERRQRRLLKVNKDSQFKKIQVRNFEEYFHKSRNCLLCKYNNYCSGIDGAYISEYHFPRPKPFT